jgi:hypothetical protein
MIITDLLGSRVFGPDFLGFVSDVRFILESESLGQPARLYGITVSPHARSSSVGFERSGVRSPLADRGSGAAAPSRLVPRPMGRHRAARCGPHPGQAGIRTGLMGASLITNR